MSDAFLLKRAFINNAQALYPNNRFFKTSILPKGKRVQHAALTDKPKRNTNSIKRKHHFSQRGSMYAAVNGSSSSRKLKDAAEAAANFRNIGYLTNSSPLNHKNMMTHIYFDRKYLTNLRQEQRQ
ncbi:MAG: hypothetical protein H6558_15535 [Lewinellaceae bacterium]|nr:hypothetical protein [Lewinellaceae bacterium]